MKKAALLLTFAICSTICVAQRVLLYNVAEVDIPATATKITREEAAAHLQKNFKVGQQFRQSFIQGDGQNMYILGNMLFKLTAINQRIGDGNLAETKKGTDYLSMGTFKDYTSALKPVNDNEAFVFNYSIDDLHYQYFFVCNSANNKVVSGKIGYGVSDTKQAAGLLEHLLNSIKFKE